MEVRRLKPDVHSPRFVFFGGKGGVGKTTCAAAFALAHAARRQRVLVVSTDPAHSLGDAFDVRLGARPRAVRRGLDAVELDAPRAFARWIGQNRAAAAEVLEHGTWLDRDDIDALLELPIPGVDELIGLIEIDRIARLTPRAPSSGHGARGVSRAYDLVVVDTAPTGHTLRLLSAPDAVRAVAEILDALQEEHRAIRQQLARLTRPEAADRLIEEMAAEAVAMTQRLRDSAETTFSWITLPEMMSLAESKDALAVLGRAGIPVADIIVNRVLTDEGPCAICDRRRADERAVIAQIRRTIAGTRRLTLIPALDTEPRGPRALDAIARYMADGSRLRADGRTRRGPSRATSLSRPPSALSHDEASAISHRLGTDIAAIEAIRGARLIFVGGKGGVGKTTVAAAIAVALARANRRARILVMSTDPAHSLGDVFGVSLSDAPSRVPHGPPNLVAREVDAAAALAERRRSIDAALIDITSSVGAAGASTGGGGTAELMNLAPPGIDELFGMLSVFDARDDFDAIVVDTAPTGHALRLLELPDTARAWVQVLLRVLLKYRTLVRPGQLAAELVDVSKAIRELQAMLRDPASTRFVAVTRAAQLPRRETERLLARLERLHLSVPAVLVNAMTMAPGSCRRCKKTMAAEGRELAALRRAARRRSIIRTPLAAPAPCGARALDAWGRRWIV